MSGPLAGIRVLDLTLAAVGPFCTRVLSDLGAEVIHIEWHRIAWASTRKGEDRAATRFPKDNMTQGQVLFAHVNAGKQSLSVNLKTPEGVEIVRQLLPSADVVVENMTPRVMQSFGLSYDKLREINPSIVMCSLTGFGQSGLDGDQSTPCTDPVAQAMSGLNWLTGDRDGAPYTIGAGIGDTVTSVTGALAIVAALVNRERTGEGQHIDLSMIESLAYVDCLGLPRVLMGQGLPPLYRNGQQNSATFPMGTFRANRGFIALQAPGAGADSPWGRLCKLMGRQDLLDDPRLVDDRHRLDHTDEVVAAIEQWMCSVSDRDAALVLLASERIASGPVLSQEEMVTHPFFEARGMFRAVDYPDLGPIPTVQPPFKFSASDAFVRGPAPELGEHTRKIMVEELERDDEEIERLFEGDVLYESDAAKRRNTRANGRQPSDPVSKERTRS